MPANRSRPELSIISPCYNEQDMVVMFHARLCKVLQQLGVTAEILYVDDGSRDDTFADLMALPAGVAELTLARLSRNFGKESAMLAGLSLARGDAVVIMDVDLQDPPELLMQMVEKWRGGADIVYAMRRSRLKDTGFKRHTAAMFYRIFGWLADFDVPQNAGDFRLMSRRAVDAVLKLTERTRFSKGIFAWIGFTSVPVYFDRPERASGTTKWNVPRLLDLSLLAITSFSIVPLRMAGLLGTVTATVSGIYGLYLFIRTLVQGSDTPGYPSLMTALIFFAGIQLLFMGVLGEYVGRIFVEVKQRPHYLIDRLEVRPAADAEDTADLPA